MFAVGVVGVAAAVVVVVTAAVVAGVDAVDVVVTAENISRRVAVVFEDFTVRVKWFWE